MRRLFSKFSTRLSWYPPYDLFRNEFAESDVPPPPTQLNWVNEVPDKFIDGLGNYIVFVQ